MGKLKLSCFCRKVSFLTAPHCQSGGVDPGMKETNLYLNMIDAIKQVKYITNG